MAMPVPNQATDVVDIDGVGESCKMEILDLTRSAEEQLIMLQNTENCSVLSQQFTVNSAEWHDVIYTVQFSSQSINSHRIQQQYLTHIYICIDMIKIKIIQLN